MRSFRDFRTLLTNSVDAFFDLGFARAPWQAALTIKTLVLNAETGGKHGTSVKTTSQRHVLQALLLYFTGNACTCDIVGASIFERLVLLFDRYLPVPCIDGNLAELSRCVSGSFCINKLILRSVMVVKRKVVWPCGRAGLVSCCFSMSVSRRNVWFMITRTYHVLIDLNQHALLKTYQRTEMNATGNLCLFQRGTSQYCSHRVQLCLARPEFRQTWDGLGIQKSNSIMSGDIARQSLANC